MTPASGRSGICQFAVQRQVFLAQLVIAVKVDHRQVALVRFADADRTRQLVLEYRQAFFRELLDHAARQAGARLELVDDDAFDGQVGVVVGLDLLDVVNQGVEGLA